MGNIRQPFTKSAGSHDAKTKLVQGRGTLTNLVEGTQGACETRPSKVFRWSKNRLRRQFSTNPRRSMTKQGPYWKVGGGGGGRCPRRG